jgi:hypothetical protein
MGGETIRASYHGYLHTSVGEAVLRTGLTPENPYHAGTALRYYTLYPSLGPLLGRLGFGPIWGFALLNILASLLFAPAWDAFAKSAGLRFAARRISFLAAILGFNALGWLGWMMAPPPEASHVPIFSFIAMTWAEQGWGWDARLQAFLPKFLNVSSFALALPFALWAMAPAMAHEENPEVRQGNKRHALKTVLPLTVSLALNPLAGGFAALCIGLWKFPSLFSGPLSKRLAWPMVGLVACLASTPFLIPLFQSAPTGDSLTGTVRFQHNGIMNFLGPTALLLIPGGLGCLLWKPAHRNRWALALVLAIAVTIFTRLPWGNQYKFARIAGLLWALPVGLWGANLWNSTSLKRWIPSLLLLLSLPSLFLVLKTYHGWGSHIEAPPLLSEQGRLRLHPDLVSASFPMSLQVAEADADKNAVLWMHPGHPGAGAGNGVVQGNTLAPLLSHSLFVDRPQIHNDRIQDLPMRLQVSSRFWEPQSSVAGNQEVESISIEALQEARSVLPSRSFLVLSHNSAPWTLHALLEVGARQLAESNGFSLWLMHQMWTEGEN